MTAEPSTTSRDLRRQRALVAYLIASGSTSIEDESPIVQNATVAEFNLALEEATRRTRCPLSATYERWGGSDPFSLGGPDTAWLPLAEARFQNLQVKHYRNSYTHFLYNAVEAFQVCFLQRFNPGYTSITIVYHVQSMVCSETPSYYRILATRDQKITECRRLLNLPPDKFTVKRSPSGTISESLSKLALAHMDTEAVNPRSQPLHDLVSKFLS